MKFFIPIDRTTVRKNPNAGRSEYQIHTGPDEKTLYLKFKSGLELSYLGFNEGKMLLSNLLYDINTDTYTNKIYDLLQEIVEIKTETKQNFQTVHTISPEPDYLYNYSDINIKCKDCKQIFRHNELTQKLDLYDMVYYEVCPKCGCLECCEIEFEELNPDIIDQLEE